jgi:hypothetical protein
MFIESKAIYPQLRGQNLEQISNYRSGCMCAINFFCKQPSLQLKTLPKQLLGSLLIAFALPAMYCTVAYVNMTSKRK